MFKINIYVTHVGSNYKQLKDKNYNMLTNVFVNVLVKGIIYKIFYLHIISKIITIHK